MDPQPFRAGLTFRSRPSGPRIHGILQALLVLSWFRFSGWALFIMVQLVVCEATMGPAEASEISVEWCRKSPGSRRAVLLPLGLLMLSLAVFGWGLQYKLSLYQNKNSITHQAPVAKLLSQKERPATAQLLNARSPEAPAFAAFEFVAMAFLLCLTAARFLRSGGPERSRPPRPPCLQALFFRPPPVLT